MIVYRTQSDRLATGAAIDALARRVAALSAARAPAHDDAVDLLVDCGELASGVADAASAARDDLDPGAMAMQAATLAAARLVDASWGGRVHGAARMLHGLRSALQLAIHTPLPTEVERRVSEGYAYYALGPELYADAARELVAQLRPASAVVVGVRSIGTSLGAMVTAAIENADIEARFYTVRPRGHPFDREVKIGPGLSAAWGARRDAHFVIVDEGPGLSGSSLTSVATVLTDVGIDPCRIVFVPAFETDGSGFNSARARACWQRHRRVPASFDRTWIHSGRLARAWNATRLREISAGKWRDAVAWNGNHRPLVHPQHERRKFVVSRRDDVEWMKFAGLARYGRAVSERAAASCEAGWSPPSRLSSHGWLAMPSVSGRPMSPSDASPRVVDRIADYLAWVRGHCVAGGPGASEGLLEMLRHNLMDAIGEREADACLARCPASVADAPAVRVDGRMAPHEWLDTPAGLLKTDGAEHHNDHFFPGPCDIAWDLAGASEEWGLDDSAHERLVSRYALSSGDCTITSRVEFYRLAYLAFRVAYSELAARQLGGTEDGRGYRAAEARYRERLRGAVARTTGAAS